MCSELICPFLSFEDKQERTKKVDEKSARWESEITLGFGVLMLSS